MTSRELVASLLNGKPSPRMGLVDFPWPETLRAWVADGYPTDGNGVPLSPGDHFGFDMQLGAPWLDVHPVRGCDEIVEECEAWVAKRNGAGAVLKHWKNATGTPEHVSFAMTSREVWERAYRPHLLEPDRGRIDFNAARRSLAQAREKGRWVFFDEAFIWELFRQSVGDVCMLESLLLDPEWIHDYNRVYTDFFKVHYELLFQEAGKPDGLWLSEDFGYTKGLFCSTRILEELYFPYYREIIDFGHRHGLPVVLHACGGIEAAMPLIAEAGFDALNPMQVSAGCDVLRLAKAYGDKLAFIGGLDARILESGDRSRIRKTITEMLNRLKSLGVRYVFGSDHSIPPTVSYGDFRYALDVYREAMWY